MFKLTKSGWCFVGLTIFLYLASMRSLSGLLFLIIGIIVGCYVLNIINQIIINNTGLVIKDKRAA